MKLLEFFFASFWHFIGMMILLTMIGNIIIETIKSFRK
jgi:hypothetical protein